MTVTHNIAKMVKIISSCFQIQNKASLDKTLDKVRDYQYTCIFRVRDNIKGNSEADVCLYFYTKFADYLVTK